MAQVIFWLSLARAFANLEVFQVDESQSELMWVGNQGPGSWTEQNPGSLIATCQGWLIADAQDGTLQWVEGSYLTLSVTNAGLPGIESPSTPSPDNYSATLHTGSGISATVTTAAIRQLTFAAHSDPIALTNDSLDLTNLVLTVPTNSGASLDYRINGLVITSGSRLLGGLQATNVGDPGLIRMFGEVQSASLPLDVHFSVNLPEVGNRDMEFSGIVVAFHSLNLLRRQLFWIPSPTNPRQFTLVWGSPLVLQKATQLETPDWADFATNAPVTITVGDGAAYYRLAP